MTDFSHQAVLQAFEQFGVEGLESVGHQMDDSLGVFQYRMPEGMSLSRVQKLAGDLALSLDAGAVHVARDRGARCIRVEVAGYESASMDIWHGLRLGVKQMAQARLPLAMGKVVAAKGDDAQVCVFDLAEAPHLLVTGTTGSGKSTFLHACLLGLLTRLRSAELSLLLIDPKGVEFGGYRHVPHLVGQVASSAEVISGVLELACKEMDRRYQSMTVSGVRSLQAYNVWASDHAEAPLPYLVVVVDEFADVVLQSDTAEQQVIRLVQMGRAAGIHLILATQRPTVNVVQGLIKANIPARVAFCVTSGIDSQLVLGQAGAENLRGKGDMYLRTPDSELKRIQGLQVSDWDIGWVKKQFEAGGSATWQRTGSYLSSSPIHRGEDHEGNVHENRCSSGQHSGAVRLHEQFRWPVW